MQRYIENALRADLGRKMVFLTGPRQVGKTTLARSLAAAWPRAQFLNWDVPNDRRIVLDQSWSPRAGLVVLDEIHKMRDWKSYLKGVYDGRPPGQAILVTGSARLRQCRGITGSLVLAPSHHLCHAHIGMK